MQRRDFIQHGALMSGALLTPDWKLFAAGQSAGVAEEIAFASAVDAAAAIRSKQISSVELTGLMLDRYERHNPNLNAIIYLIREQALAAARHADDDLDRKRPLGPLHGVPVTIKDSFWLKGTPSTWGLPFAARSMAEEDAVAVARLKDAGAVILGHTNVPLLLDDHQSYNDIYGRTNNPWDLKRTPGGSTGGGAAAVAAGLSYLSLGSDIGGSVRVPANFCGLFGHKPTVDLVPMQGHQPPFPDAGPPHSYGLPVAGPLARSAEDLLTAMHIIGGPTQPENVAYTWKMPAPRAEKLRDFRIRYVLDDLNCQVSSEVRPVMEQAIDAFRKAGAQLDEGWPDGMDTYKQARTYSLLLGAFFANTVDEQKLEQMRGGLPGELKTHGDYFKKGQSGLHRDFLFANQRRLQYRQQWQQFFKNYDAFLLPCSFVPAFPHQTEGSWGSRKLSTPDGDRPYADILYWITFATLAGLPATSFPVGLTSNGLPVGMQLIGPYLEDATPIRLAGLLSHVMDMPKRPSGYE